ncbi:MAG: GntR family transcriptional regulator [Deltaproteobacteria bacterium]|nr:GntR family transcriptional regulator [Deltaproteobacteria bacterium]MBW2149506.1 GntR family transcriptional regulator [Deltaproteobacteria bacterium]
MEFKGKIETSSAQTASILRQSIITGEIKPGTRLRETELSRSLNISRSPIREAFRILESEGLVQINPNKGTFVIHITEKDLQEIYELRILLELYGLRQAFKNLAKEHFKEMEKLLQEMERKLAVKDYISYLNVSHEFHEFYLERCGNERLFYIFRILKNNILAIQFFAYSYPAHGSNSLEEHKKILAALMKGDLEKAVGDLRIHLESGYQRAKEFLKIKR